MPMHHVAIRIPTDCLELHKALRLLYGDSRERSADTDIDWPRVRDLVRNSLREALAHNRVPAFVFEETGRQHPIPAWLWNGSGLWAHAYESCLVKVPLEGGTVPGYLLVDRTAFERLLTSAPQAPNSAEQSYIPPIVAYLLEVAERFDLTADYRFTKDLMAEWIAENPPLGVKISPSKARDLARNLGHPDFDGGGQPGNLTGKRSPDPRVPYHGVEYPKPRRGR